MAFILMARFAVFAMIWLILSRGDPSGLPFGAAAAAGAAWTSIGLLPPGEKRVGLLAVMAMIPGFLARSCLGGIDVARRAFDPRMPLDQGWIAYRTILPPGLARVSFGSETSLLPGSLVAGGRGDLVYVHCLDRSQDMIGYLRREEDRIVATLRRRNGARAKQ